MVYLTYSQITSSTPRGSTALKSKLSCQICTSRHSILTGKPLMKGLTTTVKYIIQPIINYSYASSGLNKLEPCRHIQLLCATKEL